MEFSGNACSTQFSTQMACNVHRIANNDHKLGSNYFAKSTTNTWQCLKIAYKINTKQN
jgi:hypothetical protein